MEATHHIRTAVTAVLLVMSAAALCPAQTPPETPSNKVTTLPTESPAWLKGYRARYALHVLGKREASKSQSIIARLPTGGWAKPDASDIIVLTATGKELPVLVLSHDVDGQTLIQFPRHENDEWYWAHAGNPAATAPAMEKVPEGLTVEVRQWGGQSMDNWPAVLEGLSKSTDVLGAFAVAEIMQNNNPARPGRPTDFVASYRGYIKIDKPGVHRFFVNGDDASFLFIDGFKVCDRPGSNLRVTGRVPIANFGQNIDLTAGVHSFEVHHVMGRNPSAFGSCTMIWMPPEAKDWGWVPREVFVQADYARVAAVESGPEAVVFVHGIDDTLTTQSGVKLYIVQFQAHGTDLPESEQEYQWDFGDGTRHFGRNPTHIYFGEGDYAVTLQVGGKPQPYREIVHVWPVPGKTSPFSAGKVINVLAQSNWKQYDASRIGLIFDFLQICEHPDRWMLLDQITEHLLSQDEGDMQFRSQLLSTRIEALAQAGRAEQALALAEKEIPKFAKLASLQVAVRLAKARVHHRHLKQFAVASQQYESIISDNRRLEHPLLRVAAIRWGDLCAESGDLAQAAECYRLAGSLGGPEFQTTAQSEAVTRGALLRVAEQKLRSGDIRETRALLEKIEINYPEQKLEGMYRFLRAESDRFAGRYEDALINYEVMLKLTQWSGFRDRTMFGIADTYHRMGEYDRAVEWLAMLKEAFPQFYEKQALDARLTLLNQMIERKKQGKPAYQDFATDFEPAENQYFGSTGEFGVEPGLGIIGPHVMVLDGYPAYRGYLEYSRDLPDLEGDAYYWVELWYRESLVHSPITFGPHMHTFLYGPQNTLHTKFQYEGTSYFQRTFNEWQKFGFIHRAPTSLGGRVAASVRQVIGVMEFDGLRVQRISDQQYDALFNFIQGNAGEGSDAE